LAKTNETGYSMAASALQAKCGASEAGRGGAVCGRGAPVGHGDEEEAAGTVDGDAEADEAGPGELGGVAQQVVQDLREREGGRDGAIEREMRCQPGCAGSEKGRRRERCVALRSCASSARERERMSVREIRTRTPSYQRERGRER
jgi:hypothetical protein